MSTSFGRFRSQRRASRCASRVMGLPRSHQLSATVIALLAALPGAAAARSVMAPSTVDGVGGDNSCTRPFLVLTGARSGSTWFGELLNAHPQVDYQGEMMTSATEYPTVREALQLLHRVHGSCAFQATGFKWFPGQGGMDFRHDTELSTWVLKHDFRIILLSRYGFDRYLSLQRALHTGIWDCQDEGCVGQQRNKKITIDVDHVALLRFKLSS